MTQNRTFTPDHAAPYARPLIPPQVRSPRNPGAPLRPPRPRAGPGRGPVNFPARSPAHGAGPFLAQPLVHGSIFRFEGRLALFDSAKGPGCSRCLFPEPPPPGSVQSCAEAGVFGVLPGIIGSMMAFETIKYLLDIGRPMVGRYLLFEGEDMSFRELKLRQNN